MENALLDRISYLLHETFDGVDFSLEGNGGLECFQALSQGQRLKETLVYVALFLFVMLPIVLKTFYIPKEVRGLIHAAKNSSHHHGIPEKRKLLLILLSVTLGIELSYKLTTRSTIYLLNPCHVITMIQIYLLAAEPSLTTLNVFRCHIHYLFSPFLAIVFPATNTRFLPGEVFTYWLQHILIFFVVPAYLISEGGVYKPEALRDFRWVWLSTPIFGLYMYFILQPIAIVTYVNLNNTLCAAVSDPFKGPNYRWYAGVYLTFLNLTFGKVYTAFVYAFLSVCRFFFEKKTEINNNQPSSVDDKKRT